MTDAPKTAQEVAMQLAMDRIPFAGIALWPNKNRREGRNDAHFAGRVRLSTVKLQAVIDQAIAEGKVEIELWANVWDNAQSGTMRENGPVLSGNCRNLVEAQAEEAAPAEATVG